MPIDAVVWNRSTIVSGLLPIHDEDLIELTYGFRGQLALEVSPHLYFATFSVCILLELAHCEL